MADRYNYPTVEAAATRVVAHYRQAVACESCDSVAAGRWYFAKRREILTWRNEYRPTLTDRQACTIYALMSQNKSVPENDILFVQYLSTGTFEHFADVIRRVALVNHGERWIGEALTYAEGQKIPSFAYNLLYPRRGGVATMDRHAVDIVTGWRKMTKQLLSRRARYRIVEAGYLLAAQYLGMTGSKLQAICWVHQQDCLGGVASLSERVA